MTTLTVTVALKEVTSKKSPWTLHGVIVAVETIYPAERGLVGSSVVIQYAGRILPNQVLKQGLLFTVDVPISEVNALLDARVAGALPLHLPVVAISPMKEPCVRVPISLLTELRGQVAATEMSRQAITSIWKSNASKTNT